MKSSKKSTKQTTKRYRPLGVSIAILSAVTLYCILPLFPVLLVIFVALQRRNTLDDLTAQFMGGPLGWLSAGLAVLTLITCVFAWIGRPARSRVTLIGLVWLTTALRLIQISQSLSARGGAAIGGSGDTVIQSVAFCQLPVLLLALLYITWYMNRAPARAFYC